MGTPKTRRPKPDFSARGGGLVDRKFLPDKLRADLLPLLSESGVQPEHAERFLESCSFLAYTAVNGRQQTFVKTRDQLSSVAKKANALLDAMQGLGLDAKDDFDVHEREQARPSRRDRAFLSDTWDRVERMADICTRAADYLPRGKSDPTVIVGYGLTALIVESYWRHFDRLPPADQNGWFVDFMSRIGAHLGLVCGPRPVRKAIQQSPHYA